MLTTCFFSHRKNESKEHLLSSGEITYFFSDYKFLKPNDSTRVKPLNNYDKTLIHYFDGNCSVCIGKTINLKLFFEKYNQSNNLLLFVSCDADTMILNYYREQYIPESVILIDCNLKMKQKISNYSDTVNTFLIDNAGDIILMGDWENNNTFKEMLISELKK